MLPDAGDAYPPVLGEAGFAERLTLAGDCLVVSRGGTLVCVPVAGGAAREIVSLPGRQIVEPLGDGDHILITHHGLEDAPDERDFRIDQVSLDGTITNLGRWDAAPDSGEGLAIAGDTIVVSSGGSAEVSTLPRAGGTRTRIVDDGGNIADLVVLGSTVYFVNPPRLRSHGMTDPIGTGTAVATVDWGTRLASDGTRVIAASHVPEATTSTLHILPDARSIELPGRTWRLAASNGTAWVIVDEDIVAVDLATGAVSPFATDTLARDVAVSADAVYWVTSAGTLRSLPR